MHVSATPERRSIVRVQTRHDSLPAVLGAGRNKSFANRAYPKDELEIRQAGEASRNSRRVSTEPRDHSAHDLPSGGVPRPIQMAIRDTCRASKESIEQKSQGHRQRRPPSRVFRKREYLASSSVMAQGTGGCRRLRLRPMDRSEDRPDARLLSCRQWPITKFPVNTSNRRGMRAEIRNAGQGQRRYFSGMVIPMRDDDPDYPALASAISCWRRDPFLPAWGIAYRDQEGLSYGVRSSLQASARAIVGRHFRLCDLQPRRNVEKVRKAISEEVDRLFE